MYNELEKDQKRVSNDQAAGKQVKTKTVSDFSENFEVILFSFAFVSLQGPQKFSYFKETKLRHAHLSLVSFCKEQREAVTKNPITHEGLGW